jgi:CubicO group peptidase (beta-lactamase class C family)
MAASGETLPGLLKRIIADPLGCEHMTFGMPEDRRHEVALSLSTGPKRVPIVSDMIAHLLGGVEEGEVTAAINSADGLSAVIPAANIYATAEEACRFYQMLLDGGRWNGKQVFQPETVAAAIQPGKLMLDRSMNAPVRYTPGFMHGEKLWSLFGFNTPRRPSGIWGSSTSCAGPTRSGISRWLSSIPARAWRRKGSWASAMCRG